MTDDDLGTIRRMFFPAGTELPDWTSELPAQVETYPHATALPLRSPGRGPRILGAVYDESNGLIRNTERAKTNQAWAGNPDRLPTAPTRIDDIPGDTFFGGHLRQAFGHLLLEVLPRFWPEPDLQATDRVVFYPTRVRERSRDPRLAPYAIDVLRALGVDPDRCLMVSNRALRFERLTVASPAFWLKRGFSREVRVPFRRAGDALATEGRATVVPRVYLSRSRLGPGPRRARNEADIERIFEAAGFVVVHPQELPMPTQVSLVRGADVLAGCDGSALHLGAFARPGTTLLALDSRVVPNQFMIDQIAGLAAVHALVVAGTPGGRTDDWTADLDRVRAALDALD